MRGQIGLIIESKGKSMQTVYEWLMSEEQLIETAKANGYAFDSEGRVV